MGGGISAAQLQELQAGDIPANDTPASTGIDRYQQELLDAIHASTAAALEQRPSLPSNTHNYDAEDDDDDDDLFHEDQAFLAEMSRENMRRMEDAQAHYDMLTRESPHTASFYQSTGSTQPLTLPSGPVGSSSPLRSQRDREFRDNQFDTQREMVQLLEAAMKAAASFDPASSISALVANQAQATLAGGSGRGRALGTGTGTGTGVKPTPTPDAVAHTHIDNLSAWDMDLSSPLLHYSPNRAACSRRAVVQPGGGSSGGSGFYTALASCCPFSYRSCLSLVLEKAPFRPGLFSCGVVLDQGLGLGAGCEGGLESAGGCFGKGAGSWGVCDQRDSMGHVEFWSSGKKTRDGCRTLSAGDELRIDVDHSSGRVTVRVNSRRVGVFFGVGMGGAGAGAGGSHGAAALAIGVTLPLDHAVRIVRSRVLDSDDDEDEDEEEEEEEEDGYGDEDEEGGWRGESEGGQLGVVGSLGEAIQRYERARARANGDFSPNRYRLTRQPRYSNQLDSSPSPGSAPFPSHATPSNQFTLIDPRHRVSATVSALEDLHTVVTPQPSHAPPPRPSLYSIARNSPFSIEAEVQARALQLARAQAQAEAAAAAALNVNSARLQHQSRSMRALLPVATTNSLLQGRGGQQAPQLLHSRSQPVIGPAPSPSPCPSQATPTRHPHTHTLTPAAPPSPSTHNTTAECCVCLTNAKSVVFLPCKHLCTCGECGFDGALSACPICRAAITERMTVFV